MQVVPRRNTILRRFPRWGALWALLVMLTSLPLAAQAGAGMDGRAEVFVGSELEEYLRLLQIQGKSELYPWSIRALSPREVDRLAPRDTMHPWADRYDLQPDRSGSFQWNLVRPEVRTIYNSAFPYGSNDGPIWAGRGLTTAVQAGVLARYGSLSVTFAPIWFRAENAPFDLMPNGRTGRLVFADGRYPTTIDLPQRFGNDPYSRLDAGESTVRLDLPLLTAGVSTAVQHWGPAIEYPLVLGSNAPGFLHGWIGTSTPLNLGIGRLHARVVWGRLEQSEYSSVRGAASRRFMSGVVSAFAPRGLPGLEIGGARFFHTSWPADGLSWDNFAQPLEALFKTSLEDQEDGPDPKSDAGNQLLSVFGRWVFPASGFELYGEYGREDHSWNMRDLILEPDHNSAYMLGFWKAWQREGRRFVAVRGEVLDAQRSHLSRVRYQTPFFRHGQTRQGHTQRGQTLGAPAAFGGAGAILAADVYHERGRWTLSWRREMRQDRDVSQATGTSDDEGLDVVHALGAEALFFLERFDVTGGLEGAYELNRNFADDGFNLHLLLGVRAAL